MTDPRTPRTSDWHQGTHSDQCVSIGGGPGHHECVCFCHHNLTEPGTEAGKALLRYGRAMYATKWAETDYINLVLAIEAEASTLGSSERLAAALRAIRDLCDYTTVEDMRAQHGSEQRVLFAVIPAMADEALAADPAPSDPDAERQRAIDRMNPEQLDGIRRRLESNGLSGWPTIDAVRSDIAALIYAAALPAAQEPER
jgi:hypothetical protein